jgi:hypothetical protein
MDELRILVCGDRRWKNYIRVDEVLTKLVQKVRPKRVKIIEGEAKGADTCGKVWARTNSYAFEPYPAQWHIYGKAAGPVRNAQQMKDGDPHIVIAFHDDISNSRGTLDMITRAALDERPTILVTSDEITWWANKDPAYEL